MRCCCLEDASRSVTWSQRLMLCIIEKHPKKSKIFGDPAGDMYLRSPKSKQMKSWFTFGDPMGDW